MPTLKIGTDDFKKLRDAGSYFVDKSLVIKEVIAGSDVTLIPRPRRFGKTLNMSMLRYFFEKSEEDRSGLFDGLLITKEPDCMKHQGKYPVIYLSLKDVKGESWEIALVKLKAKLSEVFKRHAEVAEILDNGRAARFSDIEKEKADATTLAMSLKELISNLYEYHKQPVVVLIDEYDSPVIEAWKNGYYEEMISFMRSWMGAGLKHEDSWALYRGVVTGILRVAKESVFSGLNNLHVHSMLSSGPFADKFGFTQPEVDKLLDDFSLSELSESMQEWYNGYNFGGHTIYNPWSVISSVDAHPNPLGPQWLNTSSNDLVFAELENGGFPLKRDLEKLLSGTVLSYPLNENTVFDDIGHNPVNIWSFLLFSGYLKAEDPTPNPLKQTELRYRLSIPNLEVATIYETFINNWHRTLKFGATEELLTSLVNGDMIVFEKLLQELVLNLVSFHDAGKYPEAVYHAFVLGLLANLRSAYDIHSNPESGYGRADIIMQPKSSAYPLAFIIEFKSIDADGNLDAAVTGALTQIEDRAYATKLLKAGIAPHHIRKLAIIISGKRVAVGTPS